MSEVCQKLSRWQTALESLSEGLACDHPRQLVQYRASGEQSFSFAEVMAEAERWARSYDRRGLRRGDSVVIILQPSLSLHAAFLGALLRGVVPAMFAFPSIKLKESEYFQSVYQLLEVTGAKLIVTYPELGAKLAAGRAGGALPVQYEHGIAGGEAVTVTFAEVSPDDVAFLQFSSGTTGLKKGVAIAHRALMTQLSAYARAIRLGPDDCIASWLPLYHDMGLISSFLLPYLTRTPLVELSPFEWVQQPALFLRAVSAHRATLAWWPNFAYNHTVSTVDLDRLESVDLGSLRGLINCSEPVLSSSHHAFAAKFQAIGFRPEALATCYAMAENTFAVTSGGMGSVLLEQAFETESLAAGEVIPAREGSAESKTLVSCGPVLSGVQVRIVDTDRHTLSDRKLGEIAIRSECLFSEYRRNPAATVEALRDGEYFSGDIGFLMDGQLFVVGRLKDTIILAGKNIYPQDIEDVVNRIDGIKAGRCVAFGVVNETQGTEELIVVAELASTQGMDLIRASVIDRVAAQCGVSPAIVEFVDKDWLLKSSSGKLSRQRNRRKFEETFGTKLPVEKTPHSAIEASVLEKIRHCVRETLAAKAGQPVSVTDDQPLVTSGLLDSLATAELMTRLERQFSIRLPAEIAAQLASLDTILRIEQTISGLSTGPSSTKSTGDKQAGFARALAAEEADKYLIAPQLLDSDHLPTRPTEIVQRMTAPHYRTASICTDERGFRVSRRSFRRVSYSSFASFSGTKGVLIGNSAAYGVGATSDRTTITSLLNSASRETRWYNFSLRASDLPEERLVLQEYCKVAPDFIVWMSGVNSLNFKLVEAAAQISILPPAADEAAFSRIWDAAYASLCTSVQAEVAALRARYPKTRILFCLQPLLTWIAHEPSPEERRLLAIYDRSFARAQRRGLTQVVRPLHARYSADLAEICDAARVDYLDSNRLPDFGLPAWLFIDRVHLTDGGQTIIANAIASWAVFNAPPQATSLHAA